VHNISVDKESHAKHIESKLVFLDESVPMDEETTGVVQQWQQRAFASFRQQGFDPDHVICQTRIALDGLEASVRNKKTALTELVAQAFLHIYKDAELSLYNGGAIRIDDVLPAGVITEYDIIKILPFGDNVSLVQLPGELLIKALDAGVSNKGRGGFLHYAHVTYVNKQWQVNGQAIDLKRNYKAAIPNFLLEKGDQGLEFLLLRNSPSLKRLTQPQVDARKALIEELTANGCAAHL
jgi:5'-nucleotidase / UDP-sugar diphosphatase